MVLAVNCTSCSRRCGGLQPRRQHQVPSTSLPQVPKLCASTGGMGSHRELTPTTIGWPRLKGTYSFLHHNSIVYAPAFYPLHQVPVRSFNDNCPGLPNSESVRFEMHFPKTNEKACQEKTTNLSSAKVSPKKCFH